MSTYQMMMRNATEITEALIDKFISEVSNKFDLDKEELVEMWKNLPAPEGMPKKRRKTNATKRPPTAYQNFSNAMRTQLRVENPDATFGEISTMLSKAWAGMTPEEKAAHKTQEQPPPPPAVAMDEHDNEEEEEPPKKVAPPAKKTTGRKKESAQPPDNIPEEAHDRWHELNEMSAADLRTLCKEMHVQPSIRRTDMIKSIIDTEYEDTQEED